VPFTVEDGSSIENANAYVAVAYFRAHHRERGRLTDNIVSASVSAPGSGYALADVLTVVGGTSVAAATVRVTQIGGAGEVVALAIVAGGEYSVLPTLPAATTVAPSGGTGCTLVLSLAIATADAESAIVRATDYIDQRFGVEFRGRRMAQIQALEWPRLEANDDAGWPYNGLPRKLRMAVAEYALRAQALKELAPDAPRPAPSQDWSAAGAVVTGQAQVSGVISQQAVGVGPIKESVTYMSAAEVQSLLRDRSAMSGGLVSGIWLPQYPTADMWVRELIEAGNRRLVRA